MNLKWSELEALRAVVTDGVTIGHPCCGVHDCQGDLPTQRKKFCVRHEFKDHVCCVTTCEAPVEPGYQTCTEPGHRALETRGVEQHTAMFQLRRRLEHIRALQTDDSLSSGDTETSLPDLNTAELVDMEEDEGKNEEGNIRPRARFGRRRTHNEQLCVATCGIILGRATFYGSEGPNGVRVSCFFESYAYMWMFQSVHVLQIFLRTLFPTPRSLPSFIFYDNNCHLKKVIDAVGDLHFKHCGLPVDVFHMKSKHKESDEFCGRHCNPALFRDLIVNGKWRFNSSAAEMVNAWVGGFQSIVPEMRKERYNFFLDEMIKRRNRMTVSSLRKRRHIPYQIPRTEILR